MCFICNTTLDKFMNDFFDFIVIILLNFLAFDHDFHIVMPFFMVFTAVGRDRQLILGDPNTVYRLDP